VRITGYEQWRFGADGLIAESQGHFDAADYQRQLAQAFAYQSNIRAHMSRMLAGELKTL
jgi:hypothetical protein